MSVQTLGHLFYTPLQFKNQYELRMSGKEDIMKEQVVVNVEVMQSHKTNVKEVEAKCGDMWRLLRSGRVT